MLVNRVTNSSDGVLIAAGNYTLSVPGILRNATSRIWDNVTINYSYAYPVQEKTIMARVRFRLNGEVFPPQIVYKIYSQGSNTHYFSGRRLLNPGSKVG